MRRMAGISCFIVALALIFSVESACARPHRSPQPGTAVFSISSPVFSSGQTIPRRYTCSGKNISPQLQWGNPPVGTKSFALVVDDPDAPVGTFVHWVVYNLPPSIKGLAEKVSPGRALPRGALEGKNGFGHSGYGGPCPPPGKPHRYFFKLYALDTMLDLPTGPSKARLLKAIQGHVLGQAKLVGLFAR